MSGKRIEPYNNWLRENETDPFWGSAEDAAYYSWQAAWEAATLAERERCAQVCYEIEGKYDVAPEDADSVELAYYYGISSGAGRCAYAIRNP